MLRRQKMNGGVYRRIKELRTLRHIVGGLPEISEFAERSVARKRRLDEPQGQTIQKPA